MKKVFFALIPLLLLLFFASCSAGIEIKPETDGEGEALNAALSGKLVLAGDFLEDGSVSAKAEISGSAAALSYQWQLDGAPLAGAQAQNFQIPVNSAGKKLSCFVSDAAGNQLFSEEREIAENPSDLHTLASLYYDVKLTGRTSINKTRVSFDYSGSGLEMRVQAQGGDFTVNYAGYSAYFVIFVDGEQIDRVLCGTKGSFSFPLAAGEHSIRLVKDTQVSYSEGTGFYLESVQFAGKILEKPAERALFLEFYGDSISCGDGALGSYSPAGWALQDHSATNGFCWFCAEAMQADYSIVGVGGIGLINPTGKYTIPELFKYTCRYRSSKDLYSFARVPDAVIIELGANDSTNTYPESDYATALKGLIASLREKYGTETKIIWIGKNKTHYETMLGVIASAGAGSRLYAMQYSYGTSGSGPQVVDVGHPSSAEQREMGEALAEFLRNECGMGE